LPGSAFPKEDWLGKIWFDKWVHIGIFGIMSLSWCWSLPPKTVDNRKINQRLLLIGLLILMYGIVMELVQHYCIINRSFELGDIVADGIGSFGGLIFYKRWVYKKN